MKKLFFTFLFLLQISGIKTMDVGLSAGQNVECEDVIINQSIINNDQLILENTFDKQQVKDKAFLDLSIREVWNTKLKPFLTSTKGLTLLLSSFSILQISRLFNIAQKMKYDGSFFSRYVLFRSFDLNAALLALPHTILIVTIIAGIIDDLLPRVK